MIGLPRELQLALVAEAARAPSAHNTQPARWRFRPGFAELLDDPARRLPVADACGRDHAIGLGASAEGMAIALSARGISLEPAVAEDASVARFELVRGCDTDPLEPWTRWRHTWRGCFAPADPIQAIALRSLLHSASDITALFDRPAIADLAALNDRASAAALAQPGYQRELFGWMRFSPRDAGWHRDGLTADCLGLSRVERLAARVLMQPAPFAMLARRGWHAPLVAEAARTRSAAALAILHRPAGEDPIVSGRRFYRFWLTLTRAGFAARPMSALADAPEAVAELRRRFGLSAARSIINVFAIGPTPARQTRSPRLPAEEILVTAA